MHDEFAARQRANALRLSGRPVQFICQALGRSTFWFPKWWRRYLEAGAEGLYDLTHATHPVAQRIARFAGAVGRENVIASADCGFASFSTSCEVHPTVVWAKLAALAEGARLATNELWGRP